MSFENTKFKEDSHRGAAAITPSDTVNETDAFSAIYVGGNGNVVVVFTDDTTATFSAVPIGTILPVAGKRVNSTGTTATLMVGLK